MVIFSMITDDYLSIFNVKLNNSKYHSKFFFLLLFMEDRQGIFSLNSFSLNLKLLKIIEFVILGVVEKKSIDDQLNCNFIK